MQRLAFDRKQQKENQWLVYERCLSQRQGCRHMYQPLLYSLRFKCCDLMIVRSAVGAASCRDWRALAAWCRSYKNEVFNP
jgi:hypothetical protein